MLNRAFEIWNCLWFPEWSKVTLIVKLLRFFTPMLNQFLNDSLWFIMLNWLKIVKLFWDFSSKEVTAHSLLLYIQSEVSYIVFSWKPFETVKIIPESHSHSSHRTVVWQFCKGERQLRALGSGKRGRDRITGAYTHLHKTHTPAAEPACCGASCWVKLKSVERRIRWMERGRRNLKSEVT